MTHQFKRSVFCLICAFCFLGNIAISWAQPQQKLIGVIKDSDQNLIEGATIKLTGTATSTKSDADGSFVLAIMSDRGAIEISMVGYQTQTVPFQNLNPITVFLESENTGIEEVIVVGYGTQKRGNLTGAVDYIDSEAFQNRPITNLSQGLQGMVANLNITPADGRPSQSPSFNVRGRTSIGQGGSALILIDGVEGNPALINPQDIESVTVLKDAASSAIYGARGAFGVVLITTKNPTEDQVQINYSGNYAIKDPTYIPEFVTDGYQWASMFNEAFSSWNNYASYPQNVNKTMRFSQEYLQELKRRSEDPSLPRVEVDPATGEYIYYDSHDWMADLYKKNTYAVNQNLSISGKSNKTSYIFSASHLTQPGLFKHNSDDFKRYNIRAKGTIELTDWLNIHNNTEFSKNLFHIPMNIGEGGGIWRNIVAEGHPMVPMFNPDGTLTQSAAYTVGDYVYGKNGMDYDRNIVRTMSGFHAKFLDNKLNVKGDFTYQNTNSNENRIRVPVPYSRIQGVVEYLGEQYNDIREIQRNTQYIASNLYADYETVFADKHYFKALAGYNYELSTYKRIGMERNGLIYEDAEDINLALGESMATTGGYEQWNILGGFFRFNYVYDDRYLLEVNGRYDGSSKFPEHERYALFPSISAGWRISNESFWKVNPAIVSDFKVRASYGSLGNGNIGSYVFQEQLALSQMARILEGRQNASTSAPNVLPDGLTWETATTVNYGVDLSLLRNKIMINADFYSRKTTNMFTAGRELPAVFGAASPRGNYADLETKGFELTVNYRDNFEVAGKPLNFDIRATLADSKSKILKFNNERRLLTDYYEGQTLGEIWGYVTDGFFTSENQIRTAADQRLFNTTAPGVWRTGDIKFKDINNDGVINNGENTVDNPGDRIIIGNESPRYSFGLNLGLDYSNFFVSAFFQGIGKQAWYPSRGSNTFWGQYNAPYGHPLVSQLDNIWSEDNPDAYFPRYTGYLAWADGGTLRETQTRYLQNMAYIRMKNLQIGYKLPQSVVQKMKAKSMSVFFSGENLFTYSPMFKITKGNIDPENTGDSDTLLGDSNQGDGFNYPMLKSYSFGLTLTF